MLYNYIITCYMQYKEDNANRVIICINRDVMFLQLCYVRFPETILLCTCIHLCFSRICLCKCVHNISKINIYIIWKLNGKIVCKAIGPYFVTLCYHNTSEKKIGPRSYLRVANQVVQIRDALIRQDCKDEQCK